MIASGVALLATTLTLHRLVMMRQITGPVIVSQDHHFTSECAKDWPFKTFYREPQEPSAS